MLKKLSAAPQGAAQRKNGLCEKSAQSHGNPREDQQLLQPNLNEVMDRTTTLRRLLIGAGVFVIVP